MVSVSCENSLPGSEIPFSHSMLIWPLFYEHVERKTEIPSETLPLLIRTLVL